MKNKEILKKFRFDLELCVFKAYDSSRPYSFIFKVHDDNEYVKYCMLFDMLKELGYRYLKTISTGVIYDYTVTGVYVNSKEKTFYTTSDDLVFMYENTNELPDYTEGYCIVRKTGKDLFDYEPFK